MRYTYYPGCSAHASGREYNASLTAVCQELAIELVELPDWNCCGATAAATTRPALSKALAARNLAIAAETELELMTPCSACYKNIRGAALKLQDDAEARAELEGLLENRSLSRIPPVRHPVDILWNDLDLKALPLKRPLKGLKVASYYGCLISRPKGGFDDPEDPRSLDDLMAAVGAEPVAWAYKTKCCGGAVFIPRKPIALELTGQILLKAHEAGADVIAVGCPFCQLLLDMYQAKALRQVKAGHDGRDPYGSGFRIPVLYFSQLMGVALGIADERLELKGNVVSPFAALDMIAT
jgi:heterodisulfide reductase subunit B